MVAIIVVFEWSLLVIYGPLGLPPLASTQWFPVIPNDVLLSSTI